MKKRPLYYLIFDGDSIDRVTGYPNKASAIYAFAKAARQLRGFGQELGAALHIAECRANVVEYPDFVLSIGPRGGIRCERA